MIKKERFLGWLKRIFNTRRKKIVGSMILLVVVGFFGWWTLAGKKEEKLEPQIIPVERGMIVSSVSASGQVLSVNVMSANTKASGIVKDVFVKDGDIVKKGDKILEIDLDFQGAQKNASDWSSYLSAKNTLESAKATQYSLQADMFGEWDSFKSLAENSTYSNDDDTPNLENRTLPEFHIAEKDWLAAEAGYKNQQAVVAQAQAALSSAWLSYLLTSPVITAPTDGVITSLMFAKGMSIGTLDTGSVTSNQKVATIKTKGNPVVSVNLSEIDVSRVELGQRATLTLDSIPDKTFTGEVIGVDRIGRTTGGVTQYPAIIRLDSSPAEILPNMATTANVVIDEKDGVLLVPSGAVQVKGSRSFVTVLRDGREQFVSVETGLTSDIQVEIISGLDEGDMVVSGSRSLQGSGDDSPFGRTSGVGRMMKIAH